MSRRSLACLFAALALAGIGCGSGDDASTSGTADSMGSSGPPSSAQFAVEATSLCDEARRAYLIAAPEALLEMQGSADGQSRQELEAKVIQTVLAPSLQGKVDKVRALEIPKGDEKQVEEILGAIEEVAKEARTEPAKFLYEQTHFKHPFAEARRLATAYGIGHCGRA